MKVEEDRHGMTLSWKEEYASMLTLFLSFSRLVILVDLDLVVEEEVEVKATGTWDHPVDYRNLISLYQLGKLD